jgi:hypothetical protein
MSHYLASTSAAAPPSLDAQLSSALAGLAPAQAMGPLPASLPLLQDVLAAQQGQEMEMLLQQAQEAYRIGDFQRALTLCQMVSHRRGPGCCVDWAAQPDAVLGTAAHRQPPRGRGDGPWSPLSTSGVQHAAQLAPSHPSAHGNARGPQPERAAPAAAPALRRSRSPRRLAACRLLPAQVTYAQPSRADALLLMGAIHYQLKNYEQ